MKTIRAYNKPTKCPNCGSRAVNHILYTTPFDPRLVRDEFRRGHKRSDQKEAASSANCTNGNLPKWQCTKCHVRIYLKTSRKCRPLS